MAHEIPASITEALGLLLLAVLFNSFIGGIVTKQHYLYWTSGFKDPIYVRIVVVAQFSIVVAQIVLSWFFAWAIFIYTYENEGATKESNIWQGPVVSVCQCVLIIMANTFLAFCIYNLTGSGLKAGLVFGFSFVAFVTGVVSTVVGYSSGRVLEVTLPLQRASSVIWHSLQAIAEFLIMYFLSQALLASRSGFKRSDKVVHRLVRNVIQIGLFSMLWAVIGLSTYFLLPHGTIYVIFDSTSGSIYTHMIYDGLLSRKRLRRSMGRVERNQVEMGLPSQTPGHSSTSRGQYPSETAQGRGAIPLMNLASEDGI